MQRLEFYCPIEDAIERLEWAISNEIKVTMLGVDAHEAIRLLGMDACLFGRDAASAHAVEVEDGDAMLWMLRWSDSSRQSNDFVHLLPPDGRRSYERLKRLREGEFDISVEVEEELRKIDEAEKGNGRVRTRHSVINKWGGFERGRQALRSLL